MPGVLSANDLLSAALRLCQRGTDWGWDEVPAVDTACGSLWHDHQAGRSRQAGMRVKCLSGRKNKCSGQSMKEWSRGTTDQRDAMHPARAPLTPAPRTSIFCPAVLSSGALSTMVVSNPYLRVNHQATAGPAILPPEMRTDGLDLRGTSCGVCSCGAATILVSACRCCCCCCC